MKKLAGIIIGIVVLIIIAYVIVLNLPKASIKNNTAQYEMSATEVFDAFELNEADANKKYMGSIIIVQGKVVSKETDADDSAVLILDGGSPMGGVMCTFEGEDELDVQPGDQVKVKGLCTGFLMDVVLNKCVLLE